jgi:hypothetical protein
MSSFLNTTRISIDKISMCPATKGTPLMANGQIPLAESDVANIPSIALSIPDFEGQAILRIFSNATQSEIACYSALVTNGHSFSQPESVGSVLGIFTIVAMIASFATAIYGETVSTMRKHYAHSLSVLVVFAVFHHIFFTGALSMNWPSVLVAFWSNYAWAAGMIFSMSMQNAIDNLTRGHRGNTTYLGAAGAGTYASSVGGGYNIHNIYKRSRLLDPEHLTENFQNMLSKRATGSNSNSTGSHWFGFPVRDGLPLPGNYSGFAGTLFPQNIPVSNAFLTSFIWLIILTTIIAASVVGFKFLLEALYRFKLVKTERLAFFRSHWRGYTALAVLRTCFIGFFAMIFLTLFQFTYGGAASVLAIGAIVFIIFFVGIFGIAGYACYYRLRVGNWVSEPDRINLERTKVLKFIPWYHFHRASKANDPEKIYAGSLPGWKLSHNAETAKSIHEDDEYTKKFGWLASRFRRTKWWFFAAWLGYEFVRACFYAGASGHPMVQVFALLVIEFIAFMAIIKIRPYEGQRLNVIMVYLLGFSKVATVALSAAFDVSFNLARIPTTAIGVVIIVIQGGLTIALLICIVLSAISTYFSISRHREQIRPRRLIPMRERYFAHMDQAVKDVPAPPPPAPPAYEEPKGPYFSVNSVRRAPKIEDEDLEFMAEIALDSRASRSSINQLGGGGYNTPGHAEAGGGQVSRAMSISSRMSQSSLPYGARVHRASWSTKDFNDYNDRNTINMGTSSAAQLSDAAVETQRPASKSVSGLHHNSSRDSMNRSAAALNHRPSFPEIGRDESPVYHSAPSSPKASHSDLWLASQSPVNAVPQPETPQNTQTPSPLNVIVNRDPSTSDQAGPPSPRSPQRTRSRLTKHQPRESIDEAGEH